MKSIPPSSNPTLQDLISQQLKELGISKSELVQKMGYTNVNKGIRRFNEYLNSLYAPSDEFVVNLLNILNINGWTFHRALTASIEQKNSEADKQAQISFKPHIIILRNKRITPRFIDEIITQQNTISIPTEIQSLPFPEELHEIFKIYNNFNDKIYYTKSSILFHFNRAGLKYYRKHNYYMHFGTDLQLKRVHFIKPQSTTYKPFGNKVFNMISGSIHY